MRLNCEEARELIEAYALGALDAEEVRPFEAHIAACPDCTTLLDATEHDAASLGLAVPLVAAPSALKARTLAAASILSMPLRSRAARWLPAAAAALLFFTLGVVGWATYMQVQVHDLNGKNASIGANATASSSELNAIRTQIADSAGFQQVVGDQLRTQQTVIDVMSQPDVKRTIMVGTSMAPTSSGGYLWSPTQQVGAFVGWGLPQPPEGSVYRLWLVYEGQWVRGPAFVVDDQGRGEAIVQRSTGSAPERGPLQGFAVTIEPALPTDATHTGATVMRSVTQ